MNPDALTEANKGQILAAKKAIADLANHQTKPYSEFNFYELYRQSLEKSELGRIKALLPLTEMAREYGLAKRAETVRPSKNISGIERNVRIELARDRATVMEGSFGTKKSTMT